MSVIVGEISEIVRYPVKSFAGERLEKCTIEAYGLYGDRFGAFFDPAKVGWESYVTARTIPQMLGYQASLVEDQVLVKSPDGRTFAWNGQLLEEIQRYTRKTISMTEYRAPNLESPELMSVDSASILIVTDTSLHKLEAIWNKPLNPRRFRANLVVTLEGDVKDESEWIGKRLRVGDSELQVDSYCERCAMITIDPDTLERDSTLLRKVNEEMNLQFGVYASVAKGGPIQVGEKVYLL
ncbi:MOSC domain-containing protein [Paenibacillus sp. H1-7]|uniref:MOSC domain-containing protein n=1 Tax=Paenibacillus sp. H1-7 TaxID=2282849 RepID=UPI001EF983DB|nr:MOSC domain-containing protein [Paenibacillus sp. H1-7]ULL15916.1 MOSC domain-containing protein [Paenibacillus sp. H1-7]